MRVCIVSDFDSEHLYTYLRLLTFNFSLNCLADVDGKQLQATRIIMRHTKCRYIDTVQGIGMTYFSV